MVTFVGTISFDALESLEGPKFWPERRKNNEKRPIFKNNFIFKVYRRIVLRFWSKIHKNMSRNVFFSFFDIRIFFKMAAVFVEKRAFRGL